MVERFWIGPPWEETEIPDGLIPLVIDAGPAFGTGHHPTTELVLRLMTELDLAGARCLDAGTGSGVLAIAACRLGAEEVTAYDIDPAAIERARSNASDNQVAPMIRFHACTVQNLPESGPWKYVFANMLPTQFAALACELHDLVEPDGRIIFSGILREVWADTLAFLEAENLVIERFIDDGKPEGGWAACLARLG